MHVVEQYALGCGAQISTPVPPVAFTPIPFDKYICISTSAEVLSKKYDYYTDALDHLLPFLDEDVKIIQVGHKDDPPLPGAQPFLGTSHKQLNYIIKNSLLVIGNDFYCTHLASAFDKPLVALFGPLYKNISKPLWGNSDNHRLLESHRNGEKASFVGEEKGYKRINLIYPEEVAKNALDLLKIPHTLDSLQTLHIGEYFRTPVVEAIPDFEPSADQYKGAVINLRLDLHFDTELMAKWAFNRKLNIVTDQSIERKYLDIIRPHVAQIMMKVSPETKIKDIQDLQAGGYNVFLHSATDEGLNDLRSDFIDWDIHLNTTTVKKDLDKHAKICDNTCFKSSKTMISKNKNYSSTASWKAGVEKHEDEEVIDCPEFWEETDYFRLYNK